MNTKKKIDCLPAGVKVATAAAAQSERQQTNRKLISSLTKFLFSEPPPPPLLVCLPGHVAQLISSLISDRLGFHVDVPQKAFKKFLITPNLKQLMDASKAPSPLPRSPPDRPRQDMGNQHSLKRNLQSAGCVCVSACTVNSVCGQFLFLPSSALPCIQFSVNPLALNML